MAARVTLRGLGQSKTARLVNYRCGIFSPIFEVLQVVREEMVFSVLGACE